MGSRVTPTLVVAASMIAWAAVLASFDRQEVIPPLAVCAGAILALLLWLDRGALLSTEHVSVRAVAVGLSVGVLMTALTYPAYDLAVQLIPALEEAVRAEYSRTGLAGRYSVLPLLVVIDVAEEVLWRGSVLERMPAATDRRKVLVSVGTYVACQAALGSWVVVVIAAGCGTIWVLERIHTRSLLAPLLSHLIWTLTVMVLHPVI